MRLTIAALAILNVLFSIPMRGNELERQLSECRLGWQFSIPMRGNEVPDAAEAAAVLDQFSIPMRGNEAWI